MAVQAARCQDQASVDAEFDRPAIPQTTVSQPGFLYPRRVYFYHPMSSVFKRRSFARWQAAERLSDAALCNAVREMARIDQRYVFLHGFAKADRANITQDEQKALRFVGKVFLDLPAEAMSRALQSGVLVEVRCEQDH